MSGGITKEAKKVLIGGVPFGRDNVGDEAILECIVSIVRTILPNTELWVSTSDPAATEMKLQVRTVPLFGFGHPGSGFDEMMRTIDSVDAFVWAGATGLSDYPEIPLKLLQYAIEQEKKTAIFCTGMNAELNPYLYKLQPGGRHRLFSLLGRLSFGSIDFVKWYESRNKQRVATIMKKGVESCGLVVLRDQQSFDAMRSLLGEVSASVSIGADPAIQISPKSVETSTFSSDVKAVCRAQKRRLGLCLSAQSPLLQLDDLAALFDRIILDYEVSIVGIPMNPITDAKLMNEFRKKLKHPEAMCVAEGRFEPDEIAGLASEMDVVISSRLHLLILASISLTPFIGISRGSKIDNFIGQFQLPQVGSVEVLNMPVMEGEIIRLLNEREEFQSIARVVRARMLERLECSKRALSRLLISP